MSKQMTRHEWNEHCTRTEPIPCKCDLDECPYSRRKIDCIDCEHFVEVEND